MGYGELLRGNSNFRFLWFGQIISLLGDWFNLIASASLVAMLTESGFAVGGLFVVRMLAPFMVSPIAGVVADRYNRQRILIITDIARALVVFGFLLVRDASHVWLLYTLTAIQLGISGFFFPTRNAILPDLVPLRGIGAANAISSATWSTMLALGAAIGGLVSGYWGIYPAFIIDGLTFLLSAVFIAQIKLDVKPALEASARTIAASLRQYLDGLRYLGGHPDILVIALHKAAISLFMFSGFQVIQVAISERIFVIGIGGGISLGLMFGVNGAGTGLGPILARYFTGDRDRFLRLAIIVGYLVGALGLGISGTLINFGTVLFGIVLRGVGGGIIWVFSTQLLLQSVPNHVRGRIFATEFAIFTLASAVAASLAGSLLDSPISISSLIWWMAGLSLIPAALWVLWLGRDKSTRVAHEDASAG
jgi:MFS family permease